MKEQLQFESGLFKSDITFKLLFGSPAQVITLLLAAQLAFASAATIKPNNTPEIHKDDYSLSISRIKDKAVLHAFLNDTPTIKENVIINIEESTQIVFTEEFKDKIERVKGEIDKLIIALTEDGDTQRYKRSYFKSSGTTTKSGDFTRPNSSSKVVKLENELGKMKEDIVQLKKFSSLGNEDKERLTALEDRAKNLENLIDDQRRELAEKVAHSESIIANLTNSVNILHKELEKVAERELISECVAEIRNRNFKAAEEKLKLIKDDNKINLIVNKVYNNKAANFDLVLGFGDNFSNGVRNIRRNFLIYKALSHEMRSNGHNHPVMLKKLLASLGTKIDSQIDINDDWEQVILLKFKLLTDLQTY